MAVRRTFQSDNFGRRGHGLRAANRYAAWMDRYVKAKAQGMTEEQAIEHANQAG